MLLVLNVHWFDVLVLMLILCGTLRQRGLAVPGWLLDLELVAVLCRLLLSWPRLDTISRVVVGCVLASLWPIYVTVIATCFVWYLRYCAFVRERIHPVCRLSAVYVWLHIVSASRALWSALRCACYNTWHALSCLVGMVQVKCKAVSRLWRTRRSSIAPEAVCINEPTSEVDEDDALDPVRGPSRHIVRTVGRTCRCRLGLDRSTNPGDAATRELVTKTCWSLLMEQMHNTDLRYADALNLLPYCRVVALMPTRHELLAQSMMLQPEYVDAFDEIRQEVSYVPRPRTLGEWIRSLFGFGAREVLLPRVRAPDF